MNISTLIEHLTRLQEYEGDAQVILQVKSAGKLVGAWPVTGLVYSPDLNAAVIRHEDLT